MRVPDGKPIGTQYDHLFTDTWICEVCMPDVSECELIYNYI